MQHVQISVDHSFVLVDQVLLGMVSPAQVGFSLLPKSFIEICLVKRDVFGY